MELSLVAGFDDLRRCDDVLTDGTAEIGTTTIVNANKWSHNNGGTNTDQRLNKFIVFIEYRRFLQIQEESRSQWQATVAEAQRLQRELDRCIQERVELESKLFHARRLLENESKARRTAETERDALVSLIEYCYQYWA